MLFLETIRDPRSFAEAAAEGTRRGKRIIALKVGRSEGGRAAVAAHTGALSGEDEVYDAFFRRHGIMAVLVPSILPPPAPFKPFVLLAGVADISVSRFTVAILIGRGARYSLEGLLALWYGERAMAFMRQHGIELAIAAIALLVVGFLGYLYWPRRRTSA